MPDPKEEEEEEEDQKRLGERSRGLNWLKRGRDESYHKVHVESHGRSRRASRPDCTCANAATF